MKVFVTGVTGFIGYTTIQELINAGANTETLGMEPDAAWPYRRS
jgi:nucleoside-diphosphate-sugar epimerase